MMYVKYQLREPQGLVIPKGPNFSRAQTIRCRFDDTEFCFRAPKHRPDEKRLVERLPEPRYQLEAISRHFRFYGDDRRETPNHLEYFVLFERDWAFYGPWFTGSLGSLSMLIVLIMPVNFDHQFSLYHPRAFEKFLGDYLTSHYGKPANPDGSQDYTAPVNWEPLEKWQVPAVRLEVAPGPSAPARHSATHVFFTLTDQILASVRFYPSRFMSLPKAELDKRISEAPMIELMNQIIDSFELRLSDEAKRQQQAAVAGLQDTSLVKDYPPLNWSTIPAPGNKRLDRE